MSRQERKLIIGGECQEMYWAINYPGGGISVVWVDSTALYCTVLHCTGLLRFCGYYYYLSHLFAMMGIISVIVLR